MFPCTSLTPPRVFAVIVLGLSAYTTDVTRHYEAADFLVFCSVWSLVVLAYLLLMPIYFPDFHNRWAVVGTEGVTMILWFAGFIAMAASIEKLWCIGDKCTVLGTAKAAAAFGAFSWAVWAATFALIVHALVTHSRDAPAEGSVV